MKRTVPIVIALASALLASSCVSAPSSPASPDARQFSARLIAKSAFVSFPVTANGATWQTAGILNVPYAASDAPRPAVLIVHGSGGVDSRGANYADALNRAGFVTLEIDLWAPRHVRSAGGRPSSVRDTLPDAFAALDFLVRQSDDVDSARIGITGFSWGGVVSMLTATRANRAAFATGDQQFAAHAPIYPVCWVYNRVPGYAFSDLTGAPVFIQSGAADAYDAPTRCADLQQSLSPPDQALVTVTSYPGATHAWDRREPDAVIQDPFSHEGAGGDTPLRFDADTTRASTQAVVDFFERTLRSPPASSTP